MAGRPRMSSQEAEAPKEECASCRFWSETHSTCRRFPAYSNKAPHEWCGEYKAKA